MTQFGDLLTHQLDVLRTVGLGHERVRQVHEQLAGLGRIVRFVEEQLRQDLPAAMRRTLQRRARRAKRTGP